MTEQRGDPADRAPEARPPGETPEDDYGFGRSRPLTTDEKQRLAREQGEAIASGRARKGHIVLRTPGRLAIFVGGLLGILVLVLVVAIFGCGPAARAPGHYRPSARTDHMGGVVLATSMTTPAMPLSPVDFRKRTDVHVNLPPWCIGSARQ